MTTQKTFIEELKDFFFPKVCVGCSLISDNFICTYCEKYLYEFAPECFVTREKSKNWEIKQRSPNLYLEKVFYFYKYNELVHKLMVSLKYSFHHDKINEIIRLFQKAREFNKIKFSEFDFLTYTPISKKRENWRGFNQSKLLAQKLSYLLNLPMFNLLIKTKHTLAQIDLTREERLENLQDVFKISSEVKEDLNNKKILLIDDICTTGATLNECAKAVKDAFPKAIIYGICLARGV